MQQGNGMISLIIMVLIFALVLWRRTSAQRKPIKGTGVRLLVPMLFMTPAIAMFEDPRVKMTATEVLLSIVVGLVLSIPMIVTTNYEIRNDGHIYAKRSMAFILSLVALLVIRLALRDVLQGMGPYVMTAMVMIVAMSYVVPWRIASFLKFRSVKRQVEMAA